MVNELRILKYPNGNTVLQYRHTYQEVETFEAMGGPGSVTEGRYVNRSAWVDVPVEYVPPYPESNIALHTPPTT